MTTLDPRLHPFRPEIAASHLRGQVEAARFVEGRRCEVIEPVADVRRAPSPEARLETPALFGERVTVYESSEEGWAWGQLENDGYVGWMPLRALGPLGAAPTHRVTALRTLAFPSTDIKAPPLTALPMGAVLAVARQDDRFAVTTSGWHIPKMHLAALGSKQVDFVSVAEQFLGTPYLWGGKTALGLDCSALVQVTLRAAGVPCPRDSDMQERELGEASSISDLRRGDLVFWKGHVAIARDRETLIHANAYAMAVAIEPISEALARIAAAGSDVTSLKRL
jgi:cell wall-associated NlpC family hydrolase